MVKLLIAELRLRPDMSCCSCLMVNEEPRLVGKGGWEGFQEKLEQM